MPLIIDPNILTSEVGKGSRITLTKILDPALFCLQDTLAVIVLEFINLSMFIITIVWHFALDARGFTIKMVTKGKQIIISMA